MEMQNRAVVGFTVFVLLVLVEICLANTEVQRRSSDDASSTIWFGPRMDRRLKRNSKEEMRPYSKSQLTAIADLLQQSPWQSSMIEGKRQMNFTPRLGRESEEDGDQLSAVERWLQDSDLMMALSSGDLVNQRSPPFAPRLGKRIPNQLGRYA